MADIIRLADRRSSTANRSPEREVAPAQILLFTGVRYERIEPVSKRASNGSKRAKTRTPSKRAEA